MTRAADYGRKHGTWCIVTGKSGLAHTRPIVNHHRSNFIICHISCVVRCVLLSNKSVKNIRQLYVVISSALNSLT